jgi:hypothetical protein
MRISILVRGKEVVVFFEWDAAIDVYLSVVRRAKVGDCDSLLWLAAIL